MFFSFYVQDIAIVIVKKGWLYSLNKVTNIFGWAGDKKPKASNATKVPGLRHPNKWIVLEEIQINQTDF